MENLSANLANRKREQPFEVDSDDQREKYGGEKEKEGVSSLGRFILPRGEIAGMKPAFIGMCVRLDAKRTLDKVDPLGDLGNEYLYTIG